MAIDIWFGQFNVVDGAVQQEGPYVGIFEGGAGSADAVSVYVLAEPLGAATPALCEETVEVIARGFGGPGQPLTASLLKSLTAADRFVRSRLRGEDGGLGVSVLAVRGSEAYLAQVGPSLACVRSDGGSRFVQPPGEDDAPPLGGPIRATPAFARFQLATGDTVLLLFRAGARLVERGRLSTLVGQPPEQALPDLYLRVRDARQFAALYLAAIPAAGAVPSGVDGAGDRATVAARRSRLSSRWGEPAAVAPGAERLVQVEELEEARRNGHAGRRALTARNLVAGRSALGSLAPMRFAITPRRIAAAAFAAAALLLLLLVLPSLARQGTDERFDQLLRSADEALGRAEGESEPARRRERLEAAEESLAEARALRPDDVALAGLEGRLAAQRDQADAVRELTDLSQIIDLGAPNIAASSAGQIVAGPSLYVLDAAAGKVLAFAKQGEQRPQTIFEEGRQAGAEKTGKARHIVWWPAEGNRPAVLLVLDDARRLFTVDGRGGILPVPLGDASAWKSDTAIAVATSSFYVLDAAGAQLWRYTLGGGGFPGAPEPLLGNRASLKDASGLAVIGGPVVSTADGRLLRIVDGREEIMPVVAADRPLLAPAPPILNGGDGLLYVADRGNQRIVRLGTDGAFRGQLTHYRLAGLQAVALDESTNTLYAIAGQAVIRATIPR